MKRALYIVGYPLRYFCYGAAWVLGSLLGVLRTDKDYSELKHDFLR